MTAHPIFSQSMHRFFSINLFFSSTFSLAWFRPPKYFCSI